MKNLHFVNPNFLSQQSEVEKIKVIRGIHQQLKEKISVDLLIEKTRESEKAFLKEQQDRFNKGYSVQENRDEEDKNKKLQKIL
jgi:hypothetical protein